MLMDFKMGLRFLTAFILGGFMLTASASSPTFEIGTWGNFAQGAFSQTFDDYGMSGLGQIAGGNAGQAAFDAYGFHMTIFVVAGSNSNWAPLKTAFAKGHEIASHNNNHDSNASGIVPSQTTIKQNVPGEKCVTMAYPNCNTPGDAQVLQTYIAGRNCNGQVNSKTPSNFAQIGSKMFGSGSCGCPNDAASMNSFADQAASGNGWAVTCNHGIGSDSHSWAVTSLDAMKSHLSYLDKNRSKIWIETFGNVARYIKERDAAKVTPKSSTSSSYTITVTDNLSDDIFNFPLSIRCEMPSGWSTANVTQNSKDVKDTIVTVSSKKYIMFQAVPDAGDVVISTSTNAIEKFFGFKAEKISPVKRLHSALIVDPRQFDGSGLNVTLFNLQGKELARYSLEGSRSQVLPIGKINSSAFIAKVAGNGKTYVGTFLPQL
jgi:hypothetical protein